MIMCEAIDAYVAHLDTLGRKVRIISYTLRAFGRHVGMSLELDDVSPEKTLEYLNDKGRKDGKVTSYWENIYSAINGLYRWAKDRGHARTCPLPDTVIQETEVFAAYIYSKDELKRIFENALTYRKWFNTVFPEAIQMMTMLCYFLGMRPSEVLNLNVEGIDSEEGTVLVRDTKFHKSRILTYSKAVGTLIDGFLSWRYEKCAAIGSKPDALFFNRKGQRMSLPIFEQAFRIICEKAGIRREGYRCGPRLMDLRHTFATHRIAQWYREGKDVQTMLPLLSVYMGHEDVESTSVYITITLDIMQGALDKLESYIRR